VQKDNNVKLIGYAQSNARVASLMRNLDSSDWLEEPGLVETKAVILNNIRVSEFTLNIKLSSPKPVEGVDSKNTAPSAKKDKKA
jgi:type IV pilus assembly protein PilN